MNSNLVEFLRFGSSIPGGYWGCCAGDIIQAFKSMPDEPSSCQSVNGDSGYPQQGDNGEALFFGPTNKDLFLQRLRYGTFGDGRSMPNHFFIIALTDSQVNSEIGKAWLPILKENGFEFIRTVDNSVWSVTNHLFGLFRNCGADRIKDQFTPPKAWTDLPSNGKMELWEFITPVDNNDETPKGLTKQYREVDKPLFDALPTKLLTEAEVIAAGAPVILAGLRSENPQELKDVREKRNAAKGKVAETSLRAQASAPTPTF